MVKICTKCCLELDISNFGKRKNGLNGLNSFCNKCERERQIVHSRTKKGLIKNIFSHQKSSSKRRNHQLPNYSINELRDWALKSNYFNQLYNDWVLSGYLKSLVPSFDRLDDNKPYSLDNIQITTWDYNNKKANNDKLIGKLPTVNPLKPVVSICIKTNRIVKYISIMDAFRKGFNRAAIRRCCNGKQKYYKGFYWQFEKKLLLKELKNEIKEIQRNGL